MSCPPVRSSGPPRAASKLPAPAPFAPPESRRRAGSSSSCCPPRPASEKRRPNCCATTVVDPARPHPSAMNSSVRASTVEPTPSCTAARNDAARARGWTSCASMGSPRTLGARRNSQGTTHTNRPNSTSTRPQVYLPCMPAGTKTYKQSHMLRVYMTCDELCRHIAHTHTHARHFARPRSSDKHELQQL